MAFLLLAVCLYKRKNITLKKNYQNEHANKKLKKLEPKQINKLKQPNKYPISKFGVGFEFCGRHFPPFSAMQNSVCPKNETVPKVGNVSVSS